MTFDEVIRHYGSVKAVADALEISVKAVYKWKYARSVPIGRRYQLQMLTGGILQAKPKRRAA